MMFLFRVTRGARARCDFDDVKSMKVVDGAYLLVTELCCNVTTGAECYDV